MNSNISRKTFYVKGMHCRSCSILIEQKIQDTYHIGSEVSLDNQTVILRGKGSSVMEDGLNSLFEKDGYAFSSTPYKKEGFDVPQMIFVVLIAFILINLFIFISNHASTSSAVSASSPLFAYFIFGALASVSSCAALVGGMILSLSKQWSIYGTKPHVLFHAGRLVAFALLGGVLGFFGGVIKLSPIFTALLVIGISVLMLALGFQMLGLSAFQKFQVSLPTSFVKKVTGNRSTNGSFPLLLGAFTFFLPCGFTLSAQSIALISGSALKGSFIMLSFALGTLPALAFISTTSSTLLKNPSLSSSFSRIAGWLPIAG